MTPTGPGTDNQVPLRVVHVVRQFAPAVGGLEEAVLKLCLALRAKGVAASVVTLDRIATAPAGRLPARELVSGIPVTRIPFRGSWRYPVAPLVLRHLGEADVVHVHAIDFFFDFLALTRLLHRKPLVASTHGGFFHTRFASRLKQVYFRTVTRASARAYAAICASSAADFEMFKPVASRNLELVANGVDTDKWARLAPQAPGRELIAIGRFASHKQLRKLFPLLAALRALNQDWHLCLAGRPWDTTAADLRAAAAAAGVSGAVRVVVEPTDAAIAAELTSASYVVSASSHEGFGLSVVEAMGAGLVPILNQIPPFKDLVSTTGCGCLVDVDLPVEAARRIETFHVAGLDPASSRRSDCLAAAARFGWGDAADAFIALYHAALGTPDAAHSSTEDTRHASEPSRDDRDRIVPDRLARPG